MFFLLAVLASQAIFPATTCPGGLTATPGAPCPALVFFDSSRAEITRDAATTLDEVLAGWRQGGFSRVTLTGHSDRSGPAGANADTARRRADAVRRWLAERGVPLRSITVQSLGENRPLIPTANGVREPQNRRVDVQLEL